MAWTLNVDPVDRWDRATEDDHDPPSDRGACPVCHEPVAIDERCVWRGAGWAASAMHWGCAHGEARS